MVSLGRPSPSPGPPHSADPYFPLTFWGGPERPGREGSAAGSPEGRGGEQHRSAARRTTGPASLTGTGERHLGLPSASTVLPSLEDRHRTRPGGAGAPACSHRTAPSPPVRFTAAAARKPRLNGKQPPYTGGEGRKAGCCHGSACLRGAGTPLPPARCRGEPTSRARPGGSFSSSRSISRSLPPLRPAPGT